MKAKFLNAVGPVVLVPAMAVAFPNPAMAQDTALQDDDGPALPGTSEPDDPIGEIIVTAQKRSETLQETPLSISAVTGDELAQKQVTNINQLNGLVPNVQINTANGVAHITIRGIGIEFTQPGGEANVAYHVDGVYVSRPTATTDSFFDVERLEVVRGPQGTLYGRNATGGAINVITRNPTDYLSGYANVSVGNYGSVETAAAISGPLTDGVSARLAFATSDRGGYGEQGNNLPLDNQHTKAIRAKLKIEPLDVFSVVLSGDYFHQDDYSGTFNYIRIGDNGLPNVDVQFGGVIADNPFRDTTSLFPSGTKKDDWSLTAEANLDLSDNIILTSITGYRNTDYYSQWEQTSTNAGGGHYRQAEKADQFSEELRLSGDAGDLEYVLGAYYFKENQDLIASDDYASQIFGVVPNYRIAGYAIGGMLKTKAAAIFGQVGYEFSPQFGIDVGARYSWEKKTKFDEGFAFSFAPYVEGELPPYEQFIPFDKVSSSAFTPKVTLRFEPTERMHLYATYSRGFKSGGFSIGTVSPAFEPQKLTDYEVGLKADWLGGALRTNLSAFYYDYSNLQVQFVTERDGAAITEVKSAGEAKLYGIEASIIAVPVENLELSLDAGWLHSEYVVFSAIDPTRPTLNGGAPLDLKGNHLTQAPSYTINAAIEKKFPMQAGDLSLRGEAHMVGRTYYTPFNTEPFSQSPYELFDAYANFEPTNGDWTFGLFIKNITDKTYLQSAGQQAPFAGGYVYGNAGPPRTYGARVEFRF
ncbi:TonB-dependent receptor [Novosphingopyxis sp.]|uniref:TonB-dependent receptor n=1 Tax=Novosphingopyxis sp. TaxID=2709690 RepID=UPI003B5CAAAB